MILKFTGSLRHFGSKVKLGRTSSNPSLEEYWPNVEGLAHGQVVTDELMPEGTFFDCATVHILCINTLRLFAPTKLAEWPEMQQRAQKKCFWQGLAKPALGALGAKFG